MAYQPGRVQAVSITKTGYSDPQELGEKLLVTAQVTVSKDTVSKSYSLAVDFDTIADVPASINIAYVPIKDATVTSTSYISYVK